MGICFIVAILVSYFNAQNTIVHFAFARMRKKYIEDNEELDPELTAKVMPYYSRTSGVLAGTQISFVLCSALFGLSLLGLGYNGYQMLDGLLGGLLGRELSYVSAAIVAVVIILFVMAYWVGTILIPGSHALVRALPLLVSHTWVIRLNRHLYRPFIFAGLFVARRVFHMKHIPFRNEVDFTYTEDEIRCIVEESHRSGRLNALENTLIKNSFDFFDLMVRDIMIPRSDMVVLDYDDGLDAMRRVISKTHHTCYPVCMEDKDQILGFVHVKDFLEGLLHGDTNVKHILREILTVPEVMPAPSLLQLMKNRRIYLAIVVDEYGGTVGMVTLEDLVEELIGEVPQAVDTTPYEILRQKDGTYEFDGTVILEDVADRLDIDMDGENKTATIGGFVFSHLERVPKMGDHVDFGGWRFTVIRMDGFRIVRLKAEKLPLAEPADKADARQ